MTGRRGGPVDGNVAHRDAAGRPADSAGQAWSGKTIPASGFPDDVGAGDPGLLAALRAWADAPGPEAEADVMARVARGRWLVPVLAMATEVSERDGLRHDTGSDMATVTLTSPDGSRALPLFSSLAALAEWDPAARPVAVRAATAAQAAVSEGCEVLLVDVASPHAAVLRGSMVWALAQQRDWLPSHRDPHVAAALARACQDEPAVVGHRLTAGEPAAAGVLRVVLRVAAGLDPGELAGLATRIGERIATDGETRARIDALTFALEAADDPG